MLNCIRGLEGAQSKKLPAEQHLLHVQNVVTLLSDIAIFNFATPHQLHQARKKRDRGRWSQLPSL